VVPCREKREGSEERTWWCPGKEKGSHDSDLPRKKVGAASDKGVSAQPFYITWMVTRRPPPRMTLTLIGGPHASEFQNLI
jgi:hypothetical protein